MKSLATSAAVALTTVLSLGLDTDTLAQAQTPQKPKGHKPSTSVQKPAAKKVSDAAPLRVIPDTTLERLRNQAFTIGLESLGNTALENKLKKQFIEHKEKNYIGFSQELTHEGDTDTIRAAIEVNKKQVTLDVGHSQHPGQLTHIVFNYSPENMRLLENFGISTTQYLGDTARIINTKQYAIYPKYYYWQFGRDNPDKLIVPNHTLEREETKFTNGSSLRAEGKRYGGEPGREPLYEVKLEQGAPGGDADITGLDYEGVRRYPPIGKPSTGGIKPGNTAESYHQFDELARQLLGMDGYNAMKPFITPLEKRFPEPK